MSELAEITVTAHGSISEMPDGIRIDMEVAAQTVNYAQTLDQLNQAVFAINAALKGAGIETPATTQSYAISEVWSNPYDEDKRKLEGYRGAQKMSVTIGMDRDLLGRAIVRLAACHGNPNVNITFVFQNIDSLERAARLNAVKRARESASDLAEAAGLKIVSVKSINFTSSQNVRGSSLHVSELAQFDIPSTPEVVPDAISHSESVKVIWLAAPASMK
jgi:uncharacterized protein YggE